MNCAANEDGLTEVQSDWSKLIYGEVKMRECFESESNFVSLEVGGIAFISLTVG
jgi:hypothetical protein